MVLSNLILQHFRSYHKQSFDFHPQTTVIVGQNTAGKSNIIEAIYLLATGKSFRAEKDVQMIAYDHEIGRVKGKTDEVELEVVLTTGSVHGQKTSLKRYLVNNVPKRRVDFAGHLAAVLFSPADLEIIIDGPSIRRRFLDDILEQVDRQYRLASSTYEKALRQRNALLDQARETGRRNERQFEYWDELLIKHGAYITKKRESLLTSFNEQEQTIFPLSTFYDRSTMSEERLLQYKDAELASGMTLVGPQRDDFTLFMKEHDAKERSITQFASRGQQRLAVLQLKMLQLQFMEQSLTFRPLLLLDDIFSELDSAHIDLVLSMIGQQQTILTTTHKEFIDKKKLKNMDVVELKTDTNGNKNV